MIASLYALAWSQTQTSASSWQLSNSAARHGSKLQPDFHAWSWDDPSKQPAHTRIWPGWRHWTGIRARHCWASEVTIPHLHIVRCLRLWQPQMACQDHLANQTWGSLSRRGTVLWRSHFHWSSWEISRFSHDLALWSAWWEYPANPYLLLLCEAGLVLLCARFVCFILLMTTLHVQASPCFLSHWWLWILSCVGWWILIGSHWSCGVTFRTLSLG